ncbi:MAG: hypothetical protein GY833_22800 [Aestuariibacter sp.]|nr:hypothetical protein [Aestuariibacter sp.]|tara:strand:+ start:208810 stop:209481 length:672 start_codon:yes stop_codon:yes gene_type:complete
MLWYVPTEFGLNTAFRTVETKVLVFDEDPDVVLNTLLVRPADGQPVWQASPDALDVSRINELTYVGHIANLLMPAKVSNGHWGFTQSARRNTEKLGHVYYVSDLSGSILSMQINGKTGVADQLAHKNRGTLLWISEAEGDVEGSLHHVWTMAPVKNFMQGTLEANYDGSQPAFIDFKLDDERYGSVAQPMAITPRNYGFTTGLCNTTLPDALVKVASDFPITT